jgi:hypothetical protein
MCFCASCLLQLTAPLLVPLRLAGSFRAMLVAAWPWVNPGECGLLLELTNNTVMLPRHWLCSLGPLTLDAVVCTRRFFTIPANTSTTGTKVVSVSALNTADSNPQDNTAQTSYRAFINCDAPSGLLGNRPDCPAGFEYLGPDNKDLQESLAFDTECCSVSHHCCAYLWMRSALVFRVQMATCVEFSRQHS